MVKALRRAAACSRISVIDDEAVLELARPFVDDAAERRSKLADEVIAASDVVVLAAPVAAILADLPEVLDRVHDRAVVTDTGSVKGPIVARASSHPRASQFVGGHPMAGAKLAALRLRAKTCSRVRAGS